MTCGMLLLLPYPSLLSLPFSPTPSISISPFFRYPSLASPSSPPSLSTPLPPLLYLFLPITTLSHLFTSPPLPSLAHHRHRFLRPPCLYLTSSSLPTPLHSIHSYLLPTIACLFFLTHISRNLPFPPLVYPPSPPSPSPRRCGMGELMVSHKRRSKVKPGERDQRRNNM